MEDLSGKKFGLLTIISRDTSVSGKKRWNTKCDCGELKVVLHKYLVSGNTRSCGCRKYKGLELGTVAAKLKNRSRPFKDLTGLTFGKLTVLSLAIKEDDKRNRSYWLVRCSCGKEYPVRQDYLSGSNSCGCELTKKNKSRTLPDNLSSKNDYYNKTKKSAERRGLSFSLTLEELLDICSKNCFYCGQPPYMILTKNQSSQFTRNGIDRRDNKLGYTIENCVTCCFVCNRGKSDMVYANWISYLDKLVKHRTSN